MLWRRLYSPWIRGGMKGVENRPQQCCIATQRIATILQASNESTPEDSTLQINGAIRTIRKQKRVAFAEITDGSTIKPLQAVLSPSQAAPLTTGTTVEILGAWKRCPPGKEQTHELQATTVKVLGNTDAETYPLQKKYQTPEYLRQIPHLRIRTPFHSLLSRFKSEAIFQLTKYFHEHPEGEIYQVQPPIITSSDCEGAGEVFTITARDSQDVKHELANRQKGNPEEFFRAPKYLTVSSQLHLEAYAAELGRVWTLSPTFRAERSDTRRHLSEFYMLEAEISVAHELEQIMTLVEDMIKGLVRGLQDSAAGKEMLGVRRNTEGAEDGRPAVTAELIRQRWQGLLDHRWPRVTFMEAIKTLRQGVSDGLVSFEREPSWSAGFQLEHERFLAETVGQGGPVFVTDYPKALKPFYMAPSEQQMTDDPTVACFDLLLPELAEIVGGSLREHRLPELIQNMRESGLIKKNSPSDVTEKGSEHYPYLEAGESLGNMRWYADLRRWGSSPHGGFGLGFDRLISYLSGVSHIRDAVAFPRYYGRSDC